MNNTEEENEERNYCAVNNRLPETKENNCRYMTEPHPQPLEII
jgi:hypothetical protein